MSGQTLTKAHIVDAIYKKTDRNRAEIKDLVESTLDLMKQAIKKDHAMLVSGVRQIRGLRQELAPGPQPADQREHHLAAAQGCGVPPVAEVPRRAQSAGINACGHWAFSSSRALRAAARSWKGPACTRWNTACPCSTRTTRASA